MAIDRIMNALQGLTPLQLRAVKRRIAQIEPQTVWVAADENELLQMCRARLSARDERQIKTLIGKGERGALTAQDLKRHRDLVRRFETLDAMRLTVLTQLGRQWRRPVQVVAQGMGTSARSGTKYIHLIEVRIVMGILAPSRKPSQL